MNIIAFLNAYTQGKSGGDMCFVEIFKRIKDQEVTIVTSKLGKKLCKDNGLRATFLITSTESTFKNTIFTYFTRTIKAIQLTTDVKHIDVIYATSDWLPDILPSVFLKLRSPKAKFIAKIFHIIPSNRIIPSISQNISHFLIKQFADTIVVDNTLLQKDLKRQGFNPARIIVKYPAIDHMILHKTKSIRKYQATYLGRLHESKGIHDLVVIWKAVVDKMPHAKLAIIGSGDESFINQIKGLISKYELNKNIDLLGYLDNKTAYGLVKGSSVFIFPSHEEGFGMAVGEALACGVPVVTYDLPVFRETFKKALLTVPCFDIKSMKKRVLNVLQNEKQYTIVSDGKKIVAQFSWEKAAQLELHLMQS